MLCLTENPGSTGGVYYTVAEPQPTTYTECVYILAQPPEVSNEFWNLTMDEAQELMPYFGLVLVAGFTFRALARALNTEERESNHD